MVEGEERDFSGSNIAKCRYVYGKMLHVRVTYGATCFAIIFLVAISEIAGLVCREFFKMFVAIHHNMSFPANIFCARLNFQVRFCI